MDGDVENGDVSGRHFFMNCCNLYEAKNLSSIESAKKMNGNVPNVSEMEDTGFQDGFNIDAVLSASTLHQYANTEFNN